MGKKQEPSIVFSGRIIRIESKQSEYVEGPREFWLTITNPNRTEGTVSVVVTRDQARRFRVDDEATIGIDISQPPTLRAVVKKARA